MIRAGTSLENPVSGERILFRESSHETGGEAVVTEVFLRPGGFGAGTFRLPRQERRFQVLGGRIGFRLGGRRALLARGERLTVPAGTPHGYWNAGPVPAQLVCELRPALGFESFAETLCALAAESRCGRDGLPGRLRLAVILRAHADTVQAATLAGRIAVAVAAPLGRRLGYEPVRWADAAALGASR
jgi:mannose-6-phosphate isomerase-like protein (cupin superfamily)